MKIITLIFVLIFNCCFGQWTTKEIDFLMNEKNSQLRNEHKFEEIITLSQNVIKHSKSLHYIKGEIYGYTRLGNALCNLRRYKEGLEAFNKASQLLETNLTNDFSIRASLHLGLGRCYFESRVSYEAAIHQFDKAIAYATKIQNVEEKNALLTLIYSNASAVNMQLHHFEKGATYLQKSLKINPNNAYTTIALAGHHNFNTRNSDSAKYYLDKTQLLDVKVFDKTLFYNQLGKYYTDKLDFNKAIFNYKKAESLSVVIKEAVPLDFAMTELYRIYEKIGDENNAFLYSKKRMNFKDSMSVLQTKNSEIALQDLVHKMDKKLEENQTVSTKVYIIIAACSIVLIVFLIFRITKNRKEKFNLIKKMEEQEEANKSLQLKVNESFEDVIQLAKENSPEFMIRFQEVYPDYYQRLVSIEPKLLATELKLCAMIYLGFSSKDIAEYTFVTLKAAQHRKFRLRKKLNIPSDVDINVWLSEYKP